MKKIIQSLTNWNAKQEMRQNNMIKYGANLREALKQAGPLKYIQLFNSSFLLHRL